MILLLSKLWRWLVGLFWTGPTTRPNEPKATDVIHEYETVTYRGVNITMTTRQKIIWDAATREQRQLIWANHKQMLKKGRIKQVEIEGKLVSVKNKQYGANTSANKKNLSVK